MARSRGMTGGPGAIDAAYYAARALQEMAAAEKATCGAARTRHRELAAMYKMRASMPHDSPPFGTKTSSGGIVPAAA